MSVCLTQLSYGFDLTKMCQDMMQVFGWKDTQKYTDVASETNLNMQIWQFIRCMLMKIKSVLLWSFLWISYEWIFWMKQMSARSAYPSNNNYKIHLKKNDQVLKKKFFKKLQNPSAKKKKYKILQRNDNILQKCFKNRQIS